jgi:uncharacterized protein (TIGR00369 family)
MNDQEILERLNAGSPRFIKLLGGEISEINTREKSCTFNFEVGTDYCHSVNVIQGGFVTAMLDAAMSHAVFAADKTVVNISSLEIKTSFLEPSRAGSLRAVGSVVKAGYKVAFLEGHLYDSNGLLTATTSSVAKLVRGSTQTN